MLGRDVLILELFRFLKSAVQYAVYRRAHVLLSEALHFRQARDFALDILGQRLRAYPQFCNQGWHDAAVLRNQRSQQMYGLNLLVFTGGRYFLSALQRFLGLYGHFFKSQHLFLASSIYSRHIFDAPNEPFTCSISTESKKGWQPRQPLHPGPL